MSTTPCHKCGGTGRIHFSNIEGGACFACQGRADTSYTRNLEHRSDEEAAADWAAFCEARKAARRARKAGDSR